MQKGKWLQVLFWQVIEGTKCHIWTLNSRSRFTPLLWVELVSVRVCKAWASPRSGWHQSVRFGGIQTEWSYSWILKFGAESRPCVSSVCGGTKILSGDAAAVLDSRDWGHLSPSLQLNLVTRVTSCSPGRVEAPPPNLWSSHLLSQLHSPRWPPDPNPVPWVSTSPNKSTGRASFFTVQVLLECRKVRVGQIHRALWTESFWKSQEQTLFKKLCWADLNPERFFHILSYFTG